MVILSTVTPGRERYCPILVEQVDRTWRSHPPMYFALPRGRNAPYDRLIQSDASTWTGTLLYGLQYLKHSLGERYVFMLLEDHVPLWTCEAGTIERVRTIVENNALPCVFFTKYRWPWNSTTTNVDSRGRIRGWRAIDVVTIDGHKFARVPKDHAWYNQCQPAIWDLDYYIEIVAEAVRRSIADPWAFERYTKADQPQHYVSEYQWPSWRNGFLSHGKLDWQAIRLMQMPEGRRLRSELINEYFNGSSLPEGLLYAAGEARFYGRELVRFARRAVRGTGRRQMPRSSQPR